MPTKSRAALFTGVGQPLLVQEIELPDPAAGEVLVKNFASGVCHSQLHVTHGHIKPPELPVMMGHESTGEVVKVGAGVSHVQPGDTVLLTWLPRSAKPGDDPVAPLAAPVKSGGKAISMHGGGITTWSEHSLARQEYAVKVPKDTPHEVTSIIGCAVMTGSGCVTNSLNVQKGQSVAVIGVGGVGLSAIAAAAVREADPIIAVDLDDSKLEFAKKFGANVLVNAREVDAVQKVVELTGGGVDFAIDAIGAEGTTYQIVAMVYPSKKDGLPGGTAAIIGAGKGEAVIPTRLMLQGERRLIGTLGGSCHPDTDFPMFLRWFKEGQLDLDTLVTERHSLDDINTAVHRLETGQVFGRSILTF